MSERELRYKVIEYLEQRGYFVVFVPNEHLRERFNIKGLRKGLPDLLVLSYKTCFFIELKAGRNGLSASQAEVKAELERRGFVVLVVRSLDELEQNLKQKNL